MDNSIDTVVNGTYHNHTTWSDGDFTPEKLVEKAIKLGFDEVGITDHYLTFKLEDIKDSLMGGQLDSYIMMINGLRKRYGHKIKILAGLEIDVSAFNPNRGKLPIEKLNQLDYVLFEYVDDPRFEGVSVPAAQRICQHVFDQKMKSGESFTQEDVQRSFNSYASREPVYSLGKIIGIRKGLTCAVGLAHPNMQNLINIHGADNLAKQLAENDIFIDACGSERNSSQNMHHSGRPFTLNIEGMGEEFKAAARKYGVKFAPSSDTHKDGYNDAMRDTVNASAAIEGYHLDRKGF